MSVDDSSTGRDRGAVMANIGLAASIPAASPVQNAATSTKNAAQHCEAQFMDTGSGRSAAQPLRMQGQSRSGALSVTVVSQ